MGLLRVTGGSGMKDSATMGLALMTGGQGKRDLFGAVAVEMNFVEQEKVDKALVVQARIFEKTAVTMPIGEILIQMGAITSADRDEILRMQREIEVHEKPGETPAASRSAKKPKSCVRKADRSLDIDVSRDKLTAAAIIEGEAPPEAFDVNDVKIMLHAEGIVHGIADDQQIRSFLEGKYGYNTPWPVAVGTEPIPDAPSQIKFHFDTDPLKIGTLTEDGLMDWKDRGQLPQVEAGDLLAEKIPGPEGREGMDVYGKKIPIPKTREHRFKCGKGARRSEDGMQVSATLSGIPKVSVGGEIAVMPTLHVQGDISLETGHVEFNGHIEVDGAVEKGYRVKGGSLRANEIRDAQIDIEGDITAMNGIFGATIRCGGNLKAGHIHHADIILAGDMAVEKEIIESSIEANGRCLINDGIVVASSVSARMGLTAMDIGTKASKSSELIFGIDRHLEREAEALRENIAAMRTESEKLPKLIENLKKQADQINTRLGEVAQEQDKCMVQHRRLKERLDAGLMTTDGPSPEDLQKTLQELKAREKAFDLDVAKLMEADESVSQEIDAAKTTMSENLTTIKALNEQLDRLNETQSQNPGKAMVRIGGNVFSGTRFTGPHSTLVLQEDFKRVSIVETDKPDTTGARRWRFELAPFR
jgi:uncharacterized protein